MSLDELDQKLRLAFSEEKRPKYAQLDLIRSYRSDIVRRQWEETINIIAGKHVVDES